MTLYPLDVRFFASWDDIQALSTTELEDAREKERQSTKKQSLTRRWSSSSAVSYCDSVSYLAAR